MDLGSQIESLFPGYRSANKQNDWDEVVNNLKLGAVLSGKVALKAGCGFVVDAGLSFPVLILIGNYHLENSDLELGSDISGNIYAFDSNKRQIGVTQVGRKEWMEGEW